MGLAKLRLKSKKLGSGKFQVDFSTEGNRPEFYGYLLAEPRTFARKLSQLSQELPVRRRR